MLSYFLFISSVCAESYQAIYTRYMARTSLDTKACQVLAETYQNYSQDSKHQKNIVSVRGHHQAVELCQKREKHWHRLLHLDSHSDLGYMPESGLLTDVSQVLVPSLQKKLVDEVQLCLPSWYKRVPLDAQWRDIGIERFSRSFFAGAKQARYYAVSSDVLGEKSPFVTLPKGSFKPKIRMQFINCTKDFYQHIDIQKKYLLAIDLDLFSTNGDATAAKPISDWRSQSGVSAKEFSAVKKRLAHVLKQFDWLKSKGWRPETITLADSGPFEGGDFTPNCLVFLLNYHLKLKLIDLFFPQK